MTAASSSFSPAPGLVVRGLQLPLRLRDFGLIAFDIEEGDELGWVLQKYTSITPKTNFKLFNAFADKDENPELPGSDWDLNFSSQGETTKVSISIYNESLERLERLLAMGFKEGVAGQLSNLEELLETLQKEKNT